MIYVDRNSIPVPDIFLSEEHQEAFKKAKAFFTGEQQAKQTRFAFEWSLKTRQLEIIKHLTHLFHNKCAYCEQPLTSMTGESDAFRCKTRAAGFSDTTTSHYWWLAYEWSNLYLCCPECNRSKRNLFPVNGKRADFGESVEKEVKLLLDPCRAADFEKQHLIFLADGKVVSETEEGRTTIDVLKLNRDNLVMQRKKAIEETKSMARTFLSVADKPEEEIKKLFSPDKPFLAAKIFVLSKQEPFKGVLEQSAAPFKKKADLANQMGDEEDQKISEGYESFKSEQQKSFSIEGESEAHQKAYMLEADRWIKRIEIHNFRLIHDLSIDFPAWQPGKQEPWVALLGENGSGKSTILQCIALAMMGQEHLDKLVKEKVIDPRDCVSYGVKHKEGYIKVYLSDTKEPYELKFNRTNSKFMSNVPHAQFILTGYGSTRLLSKDNAEARKKEVVKIKNLFDPFAPMQNVLAWFSNPSNLQEEQFDNVAILVKQLLPIEENSYIDRVKTEKGFELRMFSELQDKEGIPLSHLSMGYQSIIAFVLDIALTVIDKFPNVSDAQGIVLVDEIEMHLHPRWKMQIVSQLRKAFTRLRFIITTHDPLCLRGLQEGEVILIQLDEAKEVHAIDHLPSPSNMRIDELLMSQHFGLSTVYDPSKEFLLSEFFTLAAKHERTVEEEKRLQELQKQVQESKILDDTTFQFVEMTSKYFRENKVGLDEKDIHQDTIKAVGDLWKNALLGNNSN